MQINKNYWTTEKQWNHKSTESKISPFPYTPKFILNCLLILLLFYSYTILPGRKSWKSDTVDGTCFEDNKSYQVSTQ